MWLRDVLAHFLNAGTIIPNVYIKDTGWAESLKFHDSVGLIPFDVCSGNHMKAVPTSLQFNSLLHGDSWVSVWGGNKHTDVGERAAARVQEVSGVIRSNMRPFGEIYQVLFSSLHITASLHPDVHVHFEGSAWYLFCRRSSKEHFVWYFEGFVILIDAVVRTRSSYHSWAKLFVFGPWKSVTNPRRAV